jgi:AraC-like DNA-binding protein
MNVDDLPNLNPVSFGDVVDRRRPILSYRSEAEGPHRAAAHQHPRAQLIYPLRGAYWVTTPQGNWLVPPKQAVWIPSNIHHEVFSHDSVTALMLFVDVAYADALPKRCVAVSLSPFLRELLKKAVEHGSDYPPAGREVRLIRVMLDELNEMTVAPFFLPMSQEKRVRRVMEALLEHPADERSLEALAKESGASTRTLARLFRKETGMTFVQWKTQLRLIEAIDRLSQGQSVTQVTFDLGYSSASAFIYMFRRKLGVTPGEYLRAQA